MKITIVSKDPPGGRCTLYLRYAEAIAESCSAEVEAVYPAMAGEVAPPAMLVDGGLIAPSDGVILSPMDVHLGLAGSGRPVPGLLGLLARLEKVEADFMEGCAS